MRSAAIALAFLAAGTGAVVMAAASLAPAPPEMAAAPAQASPPAVVASARPVTGPRLQPSGPPRPVAPAIVPPPAVDPATLDRAEPREPLSRLSLALPPPPSKKVDWEGETLFRPVLPAAGVIEAGGRSVRLAGIDVLPAGETCTDRGSDWACGVRARTAFRALVRGRAVICADPAVQEGGEQPVADATGALRCRIGAQDLAAWLVASGWARASAGSPYAALGEKARQGRKGIFGPAPATDIGPPPAVMVQDGAASRPPAFLPAPVE